MLQHLFENCDENSATPTVDGLINQFLKKGRSLLRDADVEEEGTIKIGTVRGAHLTSNAVIEALNVREACSDMGFRGCTQETPNPQPQET